MTLRTSFANAERLKTMYGVGYTKNDDNEQFLIARIDEYGEERMQTVSKEMLNAIISARLHEIFEFVEKRIQQLGVPSDVSQRIVITGGGSQISGLTEFIKNRKIFKGASIRLGKPVGISGSYDFVQTASFATTDGAITYCLDESLNNAKSHYCKQSIMQKILNWLKRGI